MTAGEVAKALHISPGQLRRYFRGECRHHEELERQRAQQRDLVDEPPLGSPESVRRGEALRDEGIERSRRSSEAASPEWQREAFEFLVGWLARRGSRPFQACEVRHASFGLIPKPPTQRAWGHVLLRARKAKLIELHGQGPDLDPKSHRAPANIWRAARGW